jgi:hypothetical protein
MLTLLFKRYKAALPFRDYFAKIADSLDNIGPQPALNNLLGRESYK